MPLNTYPPHHLLQWGGTLHDSEIWSNSVRLVHNTGAAINSEILQTFLASFETKLRNYLGGGLFHSGLNATYAKINAIQPNGKYVSDTQSNSRFFTAACRGSDTTALPPQIALAVTLLTANDRGLANKGRFYLAGLGGSLFTTSLANGRMSGQAQSVATSASAAFLNDINNNPGLDALVGGLDVHVVSQGSPFLPGVARKVTGVKVGSVYDTQRRRRNALPELYSAPVAIS